MLPSSHSRGRRAPMAEINVTPLVDVMLVLLIIFMVTAPLLTAGVPVDLPETSAKALDQDAKPIELSLDARGRLFIGKDEVSDAALPGRLAELAKRRTPDGKPPRIFLRGDRALGYDRVLGVMGELNRAGLNRISLVSMPRAGG